MAKEFRKLFHNGDLFYPVTDGMAVIYDNSDKVTVTDAITKLANEKAEIVDLKDYVSEGSKIASSKSFVYYGRPVEQSARYTVSDGDTAYIAFCVARRDDESNEAGKLSHVLEYVEDNGELTFHAEYLGEFPDYILNVFNEAEATTTRSGLMSTSDKENIDTVFPRAISELDLRVRNEAAVTEAALENLRSKDEQLEQATVDLSILIRDIANGRVKALVFETESAMRAFLKTAPTEDTKLKIGDVLFIKDTEVPDYWITEVKSTPDTEGYYYGYSELETQKIDLDDYLKYYEAYNSYRAINRTIEITDLSQDTTTISDNHTKIAHDTLQDGGSYKSTDIYTDSIVFSEQPSSGSPISTETLTAEKIRTYDSLPSQITGISNNLSSLTDRVNHVVIDLQPYFTQRDRIPTPYYGLDKLPLYVYENYPVNLAVTPADPDDDLNDFYYVGRYTTNDGLTYDYFSFSNKGDIIGIYTEATVPEDIKRALCFGYTTEVVTNIFE